MSNNNQATEEKVVETKNENAEVKTAKEEKKNKVVEVKAKDVAKGKKKEKVKKPSKVVKALKETGNELKKVSWPKFKEVVKQTGIVLAFVLICAVVLFGIDRLCEWLTSFLF